MARPLKKKIFCGFPTARDDGRSDFHDNIPLGNKYTDWAEFGILDARLGIF